MTEVHRADVVGSLLRPDALKEARAARDGGGMSPAAFKKIEDRAVDEAIAVQERAGVDVVTDGEMRRLFFFGPLTEAAEGVSASEGATVVWHDESGGTPSVQPAALTTQIRQTRSLATEEFAYARARATKPLKMTLPSPLMFGLLWKPGVSEAAYADVFEAFRRAPTSSAGRRWRSSTWAASTCRSTRPSSPRSSIPSSARSTRRSARPPSGCSPRASISSTTWWPDSTRGSPCTCAAATTRAAG